MFRKKGPLVFFFLLIVILIFIIGVRYGQNVERANKVINYIRTLTPTKSASPVKTSFITFDSQGCGVSFLYPDSLDVDSSTQGALFKEKTSGFHMLTIDCAPNSKLVAGLTDPLLATDEAIFKDKKIEVKVALEVQTMYRFKLLNAARQSIYVVINKDLYPLFERTFEFK